MLKLYYDKQKQCYAINYNGEIEYFNHEHNFEHDKKNAVACFKRLKGLRKNENKNNIL